MNFFVPQGIVDSIWAMTKIQDASKKLGGKTIDVKIACGNINNQVEVRALEFIRRLSFVNSAEMYVMPSIGQKEPVLRIGEAIEDGYYRYLPDGKTDLKDIDYVMIPNAPLERGIRLENWLPEFETNWDVMKEFHFEDIEMKFAEKLSEIKYVTFFVGGLSSNTDAGHNRQGLWKPEDW